MSLRDQIEGNELDLSLNQLTHIPVKELAAASKATHLDLSCNLLTRLPNDFSILTHLVKIDLSKNSLTQLPSNFGNLINLQILDLYANELTSLPVSFCKLKRLSWLDLKNNPLEPELKAVAGDCLDEKQCQACAKKVVAFMQSVWSNIEGITQKALKEAREKEAIEKARIDKELEEQRRLKKLEKERRKAEVKARKETQNLLQQDKLPENNQDTLRQYGRCEEKTQMNEKNGQHWTFKLFLFSLLLGVVSFTCFFLYEFPMEDISVSLLKELVLQFIVDMKYAVLSSWRFILPFAMNFKNETLKIVHSCMLNISDIASRLEHSLSSYF